MYNRVGLETPRGSGTSGYIQTNKFLVKSKTGKVAHHTKRFQASKPNIDMVEHNRKRKIYAKLFEFEDKLLEHGYSDTEIAKMLDETTRNLDASVAAT